MPRIYKPNKYTEVIDWRNEVLDSFNANKSRAGNAVGLDAVGWVVEKMQSGYWKDIWDTGNLQRDVNYVVIDDGNDMTVRIGNSLDYAIYVHEGTSKMRARPYLKDGVEENEGRLAQIFAEYLKG